MMALASTKWWRMSTPGCAGFMTQWELVIGLKSNSSMDRTPSMALGLLSFSTSIYNGPGGNVQIFHPGRSHGHVENFGFACRQGLRRDESMDGEFHPPGFSLEAGFAAMRISWRNADRLVSAIERST